MSILITLISKIKNFLQVRREIDSIPGHLCGEMLGFIEIETRSLWVRPGPACFRFAGAPLGSLAFIGLGGL